MKCNEVLAKDEAVLQLVVLQHQNLIAVPLGVIENGPPTDEHCDGDSSHILAVTGTPPI